MRQEVFTLPSGAKIELRQIKLSEENVLASTLNKGQGDEQLNKALDGILSACTVGIVDVGPYSFLQPGDAPNWKKMLSGDRLATMVFLRILSYRDRENYSLLNVQCPACGKRRDYDVDLYKDLSWRTLNEEGKDKLLAGQPFEIEVAGARVTFTLATGQTVDMATRLAEQYPDRSVSAALRSKILDVFLDGGDEAMPRARIMNWLDGEGGDYSGLMSEDSEDLRDAFDEAEVGIDTDVELYCPTVSCGQEFVVNLPFDGMLMPSKGIRKRRQARRRGMESSEE